MNFAKYRVQLSTEKKYLSKYEYKYEYEYSIPDCQIQIRMYPCPAEPRINPCPVDSMFESTRSWSAGSFQRPSYLDLHCFPHY